MSSCYSSYSTAAPNAGVVGAPSGTPNWACHQVAAQLNKVQQLQQQQQGPTQCQQQEEVSLCYQQCQCQQAPVQYQQELQPQQQQLYVSGCGDSASGGPRPRAVEQKDMTTKTTAAADIAAASMQDTVDAWYECDNESDIIMILRGCHMSGEGADSLFLQSTEL